MISGAAGSSTELRMSIEESISTTNSSLKRQSSENADTPHQNSSDRTLKNRAAESIKKDISFGGFLVSALERVDEVVTTPKNKYHDGMENSLRKLFGNLEARWEHNDKVGASRFPKSLTPSYRTIEEYAGNERGAYLRSLMPAPAAQPQQIAQAKSKPQTESTVQLKNTLGFEAEKTAQSLRDALESEAKRLDASISHTPRPNTAGSEQRAQLKHNSIIVAKATDPQKATDPLSHSFLAPASKLVATLEVHETGIPTLNFKFLSKKRTQTLSFQRLRKSMTTSIRPRRTSMRRMLAKSNLPGLFARKNLLTQVRQIAQSCLTVLKPEQSLQLSDSSGKPYLREFLKMLAQHESKRFVYKQADPTPSAKPNPKRESRA